MAERAIRQRRRRTRVVAAVAGFAALVTACGGDDEDDFEAAIASAVEDAEEGLEDLDEGLEDFAEEAADALGAGGGGSLTFDGEEFAIDSVICLVDGELIDVGTVSDSGHRVFVSRNNEQNPVSVQILDPDFEQWFPQGDDPEVARGDGTFSIETATFFNNSDDTLVEASFTIECP